METDSPLGGRTTVDGEVRMTLGVVFPGQGSQKVGMSAGLRDGDDVAREVFAEADAALGVALSDLIERGPEDELNQTVNTQPALVTTSIALWRLYLSRGGDLPEVVAGHSLGEYSALVAAGVLEFADAVRLVRKRGQLMQAAESGRMAAILGVEQSVLEEICREASGDSATVICANINAPGQIVIAGHDDAVERAMDKAKSAGAKRAVLLPISIAAHSPLMQPALEQFKEEVASITFSPPTLPVVQNATLMATDNLSEMKDALVNQLVLPVRWVETIAYMERTYKVTTFIECGPGKVLSGLNKRINRALSTAAMADPSQVDEIVTG